MTHDASEIFDGLSDAQIVEWAGRECYGVDENSAVVLARQYDAVDAHQEITPPWCKWHPRRPVLMRGSRVAMDRKGSNKSGHACDVAERYLRMKKFNDVGRNGDYGNLIQMIRKRWPTHISRLAIAWIRPSGEGAWVNGKRSLLRHEQRDAIQAIDAVVKRIDRMESRHV